MPRIAFAIFVALLTAQALADEPAAGAPEIAIIHYNQLDKGKLEGTAKKISFIPITGLPGQTPLLKLTNKMPGQRKVLVRILDLKEPEYDLYIDTNADGIKKYYSSPPRGNAPDLPDNSVYFAGVRKREDLESGILLTFPASHIPPELSDYLSRLKARGLAGAARYQQAKKEADGSLCLAVMKGVARWVENLEMNDERVRTVNVIVVPAGRSFSVAGSGIVPPPENFEAMVMGIGNAVQAARSDVVKRVKNPVYRFDTLDAITPIDFKLTVSGAAAPGNKLFVQAFLTNWTDREVTGKVRLNVPSDWTVSEIASSVDMQGYSKRSIAKFSVAIPKNTTQKTANISADADLNVEDVEVKLQASPSK
ncbi:MAG: hypothetical protein HYX78_10220 [Armatimonadetes bacterium]|nr:hypothetical protein [Armatimonadota bacterium]